MALQHGDVVTIDDVNTTLTRAKTLVMQWSLSQSNDQSYDSTILALQAISDDFSRTIKEAMRSVRQRQNAASVVNNVPVEILSMMFIAVGDNARDKLAVAQTCRLWRKISLGLPLMWTSIDLASITSGFIASKIFRRGQDHPLQLRCHHWNELRLQCLTFELSRVQDLDITWENGMHKALNVKKTPSLRRLTVTAPSNLAFVARPFLFLTDCSHLEELTMHRCCMTFTRRNFSGLKKLSIHSIIGYSVPRVVPDEDILHILDSCPYLQALVLDGLYLRSEDSTFIPAPPIALPRLQTLQLLLPEADIRYVVSHVSAPNLLRAELCSYSTRRTGWLDAIVFDNHPGLTFLQNTQVFLVDQLTSMICAFARADTARPSFIFTPHSSTNELTCPLMSSALVRHYSMPNLQTLTIRGLRTSDTIPLVRNCHAVGRLELIYVTGRTLGRLGNTDIIYALQLEAQRKRATESAFCPELHTLVLERVYLSVPDIFRLLELHQLLPNLRHLHLYRCKGDLSIPEATDMLRGDFDTVEWLDECLRIRKVEGSYIKHDF